MKKLILITIFSTAFLLYGNAQEHKKSFSPEEQKARKSTRHMAKQLSLTTEQKEKIYTLSLDRYNRMRDLKEAYSEIRLSMREGMAKDRKSIDSLLTPEQRKKWADLRAKETEKRRKEFKRKPGMYKNPDSAVFRNRSGTSPRN